MRIYSELNVYITY